MKKILCVLRTSTIRQEIDSQKSDMVNYLLSKGYSEDEIEWLISKGASARKANQEYLDMLDTIKRTILSTPSIKCVAVWHLNRLGRKGKYLDEMKNWFIDNHIQLLCKTPQMQLLNDDGTYNIANNIIFSVYSATIEGDTQEIIEKTARGKKFLKDQGLWVGEMLNYGFTHTKDRLIVVDEEKMANVHLIYTEYATGKYSYFTLAKEMTSRGITANERLIERILKNNNLYEPYIGREIIDKVNAIKEANKSVRTKVEHHYLALRILKCPCGGAFTATSHNRYRCLHSANANRYGTDGKGHPSIYIKVIDYILWEIAKHLHRGYLVVNNAESKAELVKQQSVLQQKLEHLNEEIAKQTTKIYKAKELYLDGDFTKSEYQHRKAEVEAVIDGINKNIEYFNGQLSQINYQLEALSNPSILEQLKLEASVDNSIEPERQKEIVKQHIRQAMIEFTEFNGHRATKITIDDMYNHTYTFIYDFNSMKSPDFRDKILYEDGSHFTGALDNFYKKAYQTALKNEGSIMRKFLKEHGVDLK